MINSGGGADIIYGGEGNDRINSGSGADIIYGDGHDIIDGGSGEDTISYIHSSAGVNVTLANTIAYYNFDDASNLGLDATSNGYNGTLSGDSLTSSDSVSGLSAYFDGSNKITVDAFKNYDWGSDFSISLWYKKEDIAFQNTQYALDDYVVDTGWSSYNTYPRKLADINGDGMADIIGFKYHGVYTALANGDGTFQDVQFAHGGYDIDSGWSSYNTYPREVADINGDGMADIIGFANWEFILLYQMEMVLFKMLNLH